MRAGPTPWRSSSAERCAERGAHLAVVRDREAVGLVAESLDEIERLRRRGQDDRVAATGQEQLLALLRRSRERQVVEAELVEHRAGGADLALAAVDDDEVGQAPAELLGAALVRAQGSPEATPQDLLVAREVVLAVDAAHPEAAVLARARPAVLEHDHAADRRRPLDGADVEALDARGGRGQPESLGQVVERALGLALVGQPAGLLARRASPRRCARRGP